MSKLTLSVDKEVVSRAKLYAEQQGISISKMVESYLAAVSRPSKAPAYAPTPRMKSLRGILKSADIAEYQKHLATKYK